MDSWKGFNGMSSKRNRFTPEFKEQMVRAFLDQQSKKTVSQVARENGIGAETLRVWVKAYREANPETELPLSMSERARLAELEREVRELRLEREFLGKAAAFFAKEYR
jgi:transposase